MKRILLTFFSVFLGFITLFFLTSVLRFGAINAENESAEYEIIEIGTLGGSESEAVAINNEGQIIGSSTISDGLHPTAFLWISGTISPLTVTDSLTTSAAAINDNGLIAGVALTTVETMTHHSPVVWAGGTYTELETISETLAAAQAVNNLDLIAGTSITESDNEIIFWQDELISSTIPISGGVVSVSGLNLWGEVAGTIEDSGGDSYGFLYSTGAFSNLGTLEGSSSFAMDVNDLSQVVGRSHISGDLSSHAFLWENGEMLDLGVLDDVITRTSQANGINNLGEIVGWSETEDGNHAVMWKEGQIVDLNTLIPPGTDWETLQTAEDINDHGWIVGTGIISGQQRAYLLKPLPPVPTVYFPIIAVPAVQPTPTPTPPPTPSPTATPPPSGAFDMNKFLTGDGRLYEVRHSGGSQARHQTQFQGSKFFHTKGNEIKAEWEELWSTGGYIYRGTDTSPGNGRYYSLYASSSPGSPVGSRWSPRYWKVGDIYKRNAYVVVRNKSDCSIVPNGTGWAPTWLKFEAYYPQFTFASGITIKNVVQLAWLQNLNQAPQERYYYAEDFGLVGWSSADAGFSNISEIHGQGQRPNNKMEVIPCLGQLSQPLGDIPELNDGLLPEKYLRFVK